MIVPSVAKVDEHEYEHVDLVEHLVVDGMHVLGEARDDAPDGRRVEERERRMHHPVRQTLVQASRGAGQKTAKPKVRAKVSAAIKTPRTA